MASIQMAPSSQPQPDRTVSELELNINDPPDTLISDATAFEDVPPNGGYGWVCTVCSFMIIVHTWGVTGAWGVILSHFISHSTFPGATQIEYAFIGGLIISIALLVGPIVSISRRILGTRATLLVGTGFTFAGLFGAAYASEIWQLFLTQGICCGLGIGFLYITSMSVLPAWFSTRRSLVTGIAGSGAGIGGIVYNLAAGRAIETVGVQTTYKILAFCSLGANLVSSLLMKSRDKPHVTRQRRTLDYHDLARPEVLLMMLWGITTEFGYIALWYSLPSFAASIGLSAQQGSVAGAMLNLGMTIGRPVVGYTSDVFGRITVSTIVTAVCGLLCLAIWIPAKTYAALLVFALTAGSVCGNFWGTVTPVLAEVVGLSRLSTTFTLICLTLVIPTTVAEPVALGLVTGSNYLHTQVFVGCMFFVASFGLWMLRSLRLYQVEKKASDEREGLPSYGASSFPGFAHWIGLRKMFIHGRV
jgi:MFS family permease